MLLYIMDVYRGTDIRHFSRATCRINFAVSIFGPAYCALLQTYILTIDANVANHRYSKLFIFIGSLYIHRFQRQKCRSRLPNSLFTFR